MENIFGLDNPEHLMLHDIRYYRNIDDKRTDVLVIIYKDLKENMVKVKEIFNPTMTVYFTKPEFRNHNYIKSNEELDKVYAKELTYKNIIFDIPKELKDKQLSNYLKDCINNRNYKGLQQAHLTGYTYGGDLDIISYAYIMWGLNYTNNLRKEPTSMFMDIEVDSYHVLGFPTPDKCPIDVITIIDQESKTSYTLALNVKDNMDNILKFQKDLDKFKSTLHEMFDESYGVYDYKFSWFDDELELIKVLFKIINALKRTFLFVWNMNFDMRYILSRIEVLGGNAKDIICDDIFTYKHLRYIEDNIHFSRAKKVEIFEASCCTKYLCQLNNYAGIRNNQGISSYKLTEIAKKEINDEKLDFSDDGNMKTLSRKNYWKFILYNIKDVLLQVGIASRSKDPEFIYHASLSTFTQYDDVMKPLIFLRNVAYVEYLKQGIVLGANKNVFNDKTSRAVDEFGMLKDDEEEDDELIDDTKKKADDERKADGALVSSPVMMNRTGIELYGIKSNRIYDNAIDMDFAALYPSIIRAFNISDVTLIGRLLIKTTPNSILNPYKTQDGYSAGKDFIENLITGNTILTGSKWFNLPSVKDLNNKLRLKG